MLFRRKLLLRVAGEVEGEVRGARHGHSARAVRHGDGLAAEAAAVLLRLHVILEEVVGALREAAEVRRLVLVAVRLIRPVAEILRRVERFRQEHPQAEARQVSLRRIARAADLGADAARAVDLKPALEPEERPAVHRGEAQRAVDRRDAVFHAAFAAVHLDLRAVVACLLPGRVDILVVVGRRAVGVPGHRARHERRVALDEALEHALRLREHVAEVRSGHRDAPPVLHGLHAARRKGRFAARRARHDELVETERVALRKKDAVVLLRAVVQKDRHVARFGHLAVQADHAALMRGDRDVVEHTAGRRLAVLLDLPRDHQEFVRIRKVAVIRQADLRGLRVEQLGAHRADHVLVLEKPRVRRAVRIDETVHAEVAVVRELAEVAAVAEDVAVVGRRAAVHGVVTPLPDKAAHEAVVPHDELLVLLRVAGAVAHRVDVLAQHERLRVLRVRKVFLDPLGRRVHAADRIERGEVVLVAARVVIRVLVVRQAARVVRFHPRAGLFKRRAPAAFVAVGPHQHAGVVLVADHAALDAVEDRLVENRVQRDVGVFVHAVRAGLHRSAVALDVRLGDHIEAVFAAQLQKPRGVRVVARAHRVDVVLLHQDQVALRLLAADRVAGHGVAVVAVHAAQLDLHAVEVEHAAADLDLREADLLLDDLVRRREAERVLHGVLRVPKLRALHREHRVFAGRDLQKLAVGRIQRRRELRLPAQRRLHADRRAREVLVQRRLHEEIADVVFRAADEVHVAENAAHAQLVLVLEVGAVAPLEHEHRHGVLALDQKVRNVEFARRVRNLAVARELLVDPEVEAGIDALEVQVRAARSVLRADLKAAQIQPAGVLIRHEGRVKRDRVADVRVHVAVVAGVLPAGRHLDLVHVVLVKADVRRRAVGEHVEERVEIAERPRAVQRADARGFAAVVRRLRQVVAAGRAGAHVQHVRIFMQFCEFHCNTHSVLDWVCAARGGRRNFELNSFYRYAILNPCNLNTSLPYNRTAVKTNF